MDQMQSKRRGRKVVDEQTGRIEIDKVKSKEHEM
jgi:hypothetical protein